MNVPNALTLSRIFLVPILLTVLLTNDKSLPHKTVIAVTIVLIAAATDWVDGYLARHLHLITRGVEAGDPPNSAHTIFGGLPKILTTDSIGADRAYSCDYDTTHRFILPLVFPPV